MAEASATPHWRSWRNLQVIWLIDEVYNTFWEATKFNTKRLLDLGDELDDESLFHFSLSFPSWKTLKEATDVDKKELFKLLKDNSVKTFTTRIIFMKMIYSKDKSEYERLRKKEIDHILDTLNRQDKCCELVRLKEKGIVLHQESFNNIFETLALGFEESSDIRAEIVEELIKNKGNTKYKDHDSKNWIQTVLRKKTPIPWDPLVFYVCANKYECAVSIQANDTDEYRFYPETVSNKPIIKFARVESSQYVCLMRDQEEFDIVNVAGCYTSCKKRMTDTMKEQLTVMREDQQSNSQFNPNEDFIQRHSKNFDKLISRKKNLQQDVVELKSSRDKAEKKVYEAKEEKYKAEEEAGKAKKEADIARKDADKAKEEADKARKDADKNREEADKAREEEYKAREEADNAKKETQEVWQAYDKMSEYCNELYASKLQLDQKAKQIRQRHNLGAVNRNGNHDKKVEMNNAQVCSTDPVQVTTQGKPKPKKNEEITLVSV